MTCRIGDGACLESGEVQGVMWRIYDLSSSPRLPLSIAASFLSLKSTFKRRACRHV